MAYSYDTLTISCLHTLCSSSFHWRESDLSDLKRVAVCMTAFGLTVMTLLRADRPLTIYVHLFEQSIAKCFGELQSGTTTFKSNHPSADILDITTLSCHKDAVRSSTDLFYTQLWHSPFNNDITRTQNPQASDTWKSPFAITQENGLAQFIC